MTLRFTPSYRETKLLTDGTPVVLRLLRRSDAILLVHAFERLSPESRYRRFFAYKNALSPDEIRYLTECDGTNHFAIAAVIERADGGEEGVGVARFVRLQEDPLAAETAVTVIDAFQHNGLGGLLVQRLFSAATERGVHRLQFFVLAENQPMLALLRELAPGAEARADARFGGIAVKFVVPVPSFPAIEADASAPERTRARATG